MITALLLLLGAGLFLALTLSVVFEHFDRDRSESPTVFWLRLWLIALCGGSVGFLLMLTALSLPL